MDDLVRAMSCPISGEIMKDPVILARSGVSYERAAIEAWIVERATDPGSGEPLEQDARLIENPCLKALIESVIDARAAASVGY
jgi:hypothetical protein